MPLRLVSILPVRAYVGLAYRVRGWGRFRARRGPTLIVTNNQHDLDDMVIVSQLTLEGGWRDPIYTVSSRRQFEPGFLAVRLPWLAPLLRTYNPAAFFEVIGMRPIENQLATRSAANIAWMLAQRHPELRLREVFDDATMARLRVTDAPAREAFAPNLFAPLQAPVKIALVKEPFRGEMLAAMRDQIEEDLRCLEALMRRGATFYLSPEGRHSLDGRMSRFRGAYSRLLPYATVWIAPVSYDPFVGNKLSVLYRLLPVEDKTRVERVLRATRPVTTSQLLGEYVSGRREPFSRGAAAEAVRTRLSSLPRGAFVDPELRARPHELTAAALAKLTRLELLHERNGCYLRGTRSSSPDFPRVADIFTYQANFLEETLTALA